MLMATGSEDGEISTDDDDDLPTVTSIMTAASNVSKSDVSATIITPAKLNVSHLKKLGEKKLKLAELKVGEGTLANWKHAHTWYPARVIEVQEVKNQVNYKLEWYDGSLSAWMPRHKICSVEDDQFSRLTIAPDVVEYFAAQENYIDDELCEQIESFHEYLVALFDGTATC